MVLNWYLNLPKYEHRLKNQNFPKLKQTNTTIQKNGLFFYCLGGSNFSLV
jgi:hypothetical protein